MTTSYALTVNQGNDELIELTITDADTSEPYPIGTVHVEFYIKTTSTTPDGDPSTHKLSTVTGEITAVDVTEGIMQVAIPSTVLSASGAFWWRADVVGLAGSPRKTGGCGNLTITPV